MTIWGVGPLFALFSFLYFGFALVLHIVFYPLFIIESIPYAVLVCVGGLLLCAGIPLWVVSAKAVIKGFSKGELITRGVYSICRHPLYGQAIFYTVPGFLMFFKSYILFTLPVFMMILFRFLIATEEDYLNKQFGRRFADYKNSVNLVFPKFWKLLNSHKA